MQEFSDRVKRIAALYAEGNLSTLANRLDLTPAALSRMTGPGKAPSAQTLEMLVRKFPALNPHWLLTGEGPEQRAPDDRSAIDTVLGEMEGVLQDLRSRWAGLSASATQEVGQQGMDATRSLETDGESDDAGPQGPGSDPPNGKSPPDP